MQSNGDITKIQALKVCDEVSGLFCLDLKIKQLNLYL